MGPRTGAVAAAYALLALLWVGVFPHFGSPNELSRWASAASLVEHGSLALTRDVLALLPPGFEDLSEKDGRVFSNKAPGAALVALPGYLAARPFAGPPSALSLRPALVSMRWAGATIPALLLALAFARASRRLGADDARSAAALLALLFATPLLAYGLQLFAHALGAACLFGAWVLLFLPEDGASLGRRDVAAGALIGLAVFADYPLAVPGVVLVVCAAASGARRGARVVLGGVPFALLLGLYDALCFGSPFALSAAHEKFGGFAAMRSEGLFGIGLPSARFAVALLLDPAKGLLLFSPVLLVALAAFPSARKGLSLPALASLVLVPVSLVALYAGFRDWHGGWTVGARYLVPALPFLLLPLARGKGGKLEAALLGASVAAVGLLTLTFPFAPEGVPLPWATLALPLLSDGLVAPNLLHLVARPLAVAVPFVLLALACAAALPPRRLLPLGLGAGLLLAGSALLPAAREPSPAIRAQVGYLTDVYFDRPGALERSLGSSVAVPPRLDARRRRERELPPPAWPF